MTIRTQALCCCILIIMLSASVLNGEQAKMADSFVDSIGVCCHFSEQSSPYYMQTTQAISAFQRSRIRHARDNSWSQSDPGNAKRAALISAMSSIGIRLGFNLYCEMDCGDSTHTVVPMLQQNLSSWIAASNIDSFEGPNEHTGAWACSPTNEFNIQLQGYQPSLYAKVRASASYSNLPVIGPSIYDYSGVCAAAIGNLTNSMTYANHHSYPVGMMPSWNINRGNTTAINLSNQPYTAAMFLMNGVMPVMVTETGYYTSLSNSGDGTTEAQGGKYYSRLFFEYYNSGAVRTYAYELFDEPWRAVTNEPLGGKEANFGLIRSNGTDKPAFTAIINEIALLEDRGSAFTPGNLDYSVSVSNIRLHHTLLQKRDKRFYLVLWLEYSYWESFSNLPLTLSFSKQAVKINQYDPLTSSNAVASVINTNSYSITVSDKAVILELTFGTNAPVISGAPLSTVTNQSFTVALGVNENYGYWSTNGGITFSSFTTNGTNISITKDTTLLYYGCDVLGYTGVTNSRTYIFDTNAPMISGAPASFTTNLAFIVSMAMNEDYGYWSTNGSVYSTFAIPGTNILIGSSTTLSYYGKDVLGNTSVTNTRFYIIGTGYPDTPQFPAALAVDGNTIRLLWKDASSNETAFHIYRSIDDLSYACAGSVAAGVTNFIDTGLTCNTMYYYRVIATNAAGASMQSATASVYTAVESVVSALNVAFDVIAGKVQFIYTLVKNCVEPANMAVAYSPAGKHVYSPLTIGVNPCFSNGMYSNIWTVPAGFDTQRRIDVMITPIIGTNTGTPCAVLNVDLSRLFTLATNFENAVALNNPCRDHGNIIFVNVPSDTSGVIYSVSGRIVKRLGAVSNGERLRWDLLDEKGQKSSPGVYLCHLSSIIGSKLIKVMLQR